MDERILPGILVLLIVVVVFALMGWGWRNKLKRQSDVAQLPAVPETLGEALISVPGQYVVTTSTGDWLDRLAVHGLGIRTPGVVNVHPEGIVIERSGAQDIFIAKEFLTEVGTQSGMAGKFVEKDGLVVMSWLLAGTEVDTGFRTTEGGAKRPLLDTLGILRPAGPTVADNGNNENAAADEHHPDTPSAERNGKNN